MSTPLSPVGIKLISKSYGDFVGMDTSIPATSMETGEKQALAMMMNCYADWRGVINLDSPYKKASDSQRNVRHIRFQSPEIYCYTNSGIHATSLHSSRGHSDENAYTKNSIVTSTVFNGLAFFASAGQSMKSYNGSIFNDVDGKNGNPAYVTTIQRRLVIAGMPLNKTEIWTSRVDDQNIWPDDEEEKSVSVLRAARLDLKNIIGTGEEIKGISAIDSTRLAIFTTDKTIIYNTHPDYTKWAVDTSASIHFGTISHNSIVQANGDLLFCSRSGVHTIKRSISNGIVTYSMPMSERVRRTYIRLVKMVDNPESITATYDSDMAQYHIFFPVNKAVCYRLTATIPPNSEQSSPLDMKWSMGDFLIGQCGAFLNGRLLIGTPTGVYEKLDQDSVDRDLVRPDFSFDTPILWMDDGSVLKEGLSIIIQAAGKGDLLVVARDEGGKELGHLTIALEDEMTDGVFEVPILRQQLRKFEYRFRGLQLNFSSRSEGHIQVIAFAINARKP